MVKAWEKRSATCEGCDQPFTYEYKSGRKPSLCPICYQRLLDPPPPVDDAHCRICQTEITQVQRPEGKGNAGRAATFCRNCFKLHRNVQSAESKRKSREKAGV